MSRRDTSRRWRRVTPFLIVLPLLLSSAVFGINVANADPVDEPGILIVTPAEGDLSTPVEVTTVGSCNRGVAFVVALRGKGIDPETAGNLVGATNLDRRFIKNAVWYRTPLQSNFGEFFITEVGRVPTGDYRLIFACRNALDFEWLQTYEALITFKRNGRFIVQGESALDPIETLLAKGIVTDVDVNDVLLPEDGAVDDEMSRDDRAEGGMLTDPDEFSAQEVSAQATAGNGGELRTVLLIGGIVLLVGAGSAWFVMRRRENQVHTQEEIA